MDLPNPLCDGGITGITFQPEQQHVMAGNFCRVRFLLGAVFSPQIVQATNVRPKCNACTTAGMGLKWSLSPAAQRSVRRSNHLRSNVSCHEVPAVRTMSDRRAAEHEYQKMVKWFIASAVIVLSFDRLQR
jgi:hypothetical protein